MTDRQAKRKSLARLRQQQRSAEKKRQEAMIAAIGAVTQVIDLTAQVANDLPFPMDLFYTPGGHFVRRR